jgi:hypothetical protein
MPSRTIANADGPGSIRRVTCAILNATFERDDHGRAMIGWTVVANATSA